MQAEQQWQACTRIAIWLGPTGDPVGFAKDWYFDGEHVEACAGGCGPFDTIEELVEQLLALKRRRDLCP